MAPDIEVRQIPAEVIAGRDPQLEAAVVEALRLLETEGVRILTEPGSAGAGEAAGGVRDTGNMKTAENLARQPRSAPRGGHGHG